MSVFASYRLSSPQARQSAREAILVAPEGYMVSIAEPVRNSEQNARLHALLGDIRRSGATWDGVTHPVWFWKGLAVSGWTIATKAEGTVTRGWEGEIALIRKSTTQMSVRELTSLQDYIESWMAGRNPPIPVRDTRHAA